MQKGRQLWLFFTLASITAAEIIVSAMSLLLHGVVAPDYLLTGLVAAAFVAPATLAVFSKLLENSRLGKLHALELHQLRARKNLQVGLDAARMVFWELDLRSGQLMFDDSRLHWLGVTPSANLHRLDDLLERVHSDDRPPLLGSIGKRSGAGADGVGQEYRFLRPDGQLAWHRTVGRVAERDDHGQPLLVAGCTLDITAQKLVQDKLRLAALVLEHSSEAMLATDSDNRIVDINPAFTTLTGYTRDEVIGQTPSLLRSGRQGDEFYKNMWSELAAKGHWQGELWNKRKNGEIFAERLSINTAYHEDGSVNRRVALLSDITHRKQAEELMWRHANFDALTNLPNRRMFLDRLTQDMLKVQRNGLTLAVLFLDLDRFKEVNDSLGHEAGDLLLAQAAQRIAACVRASDTVARIGGDEFTVILAELDDAGHVDIIAAEIIAALAKPFELDGPVAQVTASIGIALHPMDAPDIDGLMQNADQAMYQAKRAGRGRFSFYTREMQEQAQDHLDLMADLRLAMTNGQLKLFYQPIVDLKTSRPHKVEALLRWFHPVRGMVGPANFIPLAEEYGLIHEVGDWVFAQALQQTKRWAHVMDKNFSMALNMSPLQLLQANVNHVGWREQLASIGIGGENFVIEVSENLLHDASELVTSQLKEFQDAGTGVAIDHFGAACASFFELKKRHVAFFKIETATVQKLAVGTDELALASAVVVMAHQLNVKVIAQGVETAQQHRLLMEMGCDFAQGYFYAQPMAADEVEAMFAGAKALNLAA